MAERRLEDLRYLTEFIEDSNLTPVSDRTYPLPDVSGAIRYLARGHPAGKILVTMWHPSAGQDCKLLVVWNRRSRARSALLTQLTSRCQEPPRGSLAAEPPPGTRTTSDQALHLRLTPRVRRGLFPYPLDVGGVSAK